VSIVVLKMDYSWFEIDGTKLSQRLDVIAGIHDVVKHTPDGQLFMQPPGYQHYHLLAYISSMLPDGTRVLEIGTRTGESAAALKIGNPTIKLTTVDLVDVIIPELKETIDFRLCNGMDVLDEFKDIPFMFIDVDPHDGVQEREMIKKLVEVGFKGILMLDDIHLNPEMQSFWDEIQYTKIDLSRIGHYSGTGIVFFDK